MCTRLFGSWVKQKKQKNSWLIVLSWIANNHKLAIVRISIPTPVYWPQMQRLFCLIRRKASMNIIDNSNFSTVSSREVIGRKERGIFFFSTNAALVVPFTWLTCSVEYSMPPLNPFNDAVLLNQFRKNLWCAVRWSFLSLLNRKFRVQY